MGIGFMPAIHTPGRVTSALPAMLDGCHAGRHTMGEMRVLVVEDHATLAGRIVQGLRQAGMAGDAAFTSVGAVTMARLRPKLGDPPLIETVVGKGYRM